MNTNTQSARANLAHAQTDTLNWKELQVLNFYRDHPGADWVDCSESIGISDVEALDTSINLEMRRYLDSHETPTSIRCFSERTI